MSEGLTNQDEFLKIVAERASAGLIILTLDATVVWANDAYLKIFQLPVHEVQGKRPFDYACSDENRPSEEFIRNFRYNPDDLGDEIDVIRENTRSDGKTIWLRLNTSLYEAPDGETYVVVVCWDVTTEVEQKRALEQTTEELVHLANYDHLTNVYNRRAILQYFEDYLGQPWNPEDQVGLLHIDLDRFKEINDTFSHSAGDAILVETARRLQNSVREQDVVGRIGGDEFVIACRGITSLQELQAVGDSLIKVFAEPIPWGKYEINSGLSVGAALSDASVTDVDDLFARADFALYDAKRKGRGQCSPYNSELYARHMEELQMARDLKQAIHSRDLVYHFQPIICAQTPDVYAFETLVRWEHPEHGLIPPDRFLGIAESLGMMADVDFCAIDAAVDLKQCLNDAGFTTVRVTFNASEALLNHPDFIDYLLFAIDSPGLTRDEIIVEVLETVVFQKQSGETPVVRVLERLHAAGLRTVLDDFGNGHAGLAHLARLKLTGVKIDASLIRGLVQEESAPKVLRALIDICHDLELPVTTEGVETEAQRDWIMRLGADNLQGFFTSGAVERPRVIEWISAYLEGQGTEEDRIHYLSQSQQKRIS